MTKSLNIGIVGGSISGCSAAIYLSRAGHEVTIFERSTGKLQGRGGGIATPMAMFRTVVEEDIIDADFPHTIVREMPFIARASNEDQLGRTAWTLPVDLACFHWGSLWENLRERVDDSSYLNGRHVTDASMHGSDSVTLQLEDGSTHEFDLVLFADGYHSLGRSLLEPDSELSYRGYLLWRGLLPEERMRNSGPLVGKMPRLSFPNLGGHFVTYIVPGIEGSTIEGERLYNWGAYIPIDDDLPELMIDREGRSHIGSLPPGSMRLENEKRLKELMAANLPAYYAEIVDKSEHTFIQLIYTADVQAYARDRIGLLGDAGDVIQPFTTSGVFKGFNNARDLGAAFNDEQSVDAAIAYWSNTQTQRSQRILALGEQMEQAFIWNPLDFATADAATTEAWWRATVGEEEEFTIEGER